MSRRRRRRRRSQRMSRRRPRRRPNRAFRVQHRTRTRKAAEFEFDASPKFRLQKARHPGIIGGPCVTSRSGAVSGAAPRRRSRGWCGWSARRKGGSCWTATGRRPGGVPTCAPHRTAWRLPCGGRASTALSARRCRGKQWKSCGRRSEGFWQGPDLAAPASRRSLPEDRSRERRTPARCRSYVGRMPRKRARTERRSAAPAGLPGVSPGVPFGWRLIMEI